ncbi:CHAD domain-containing protein [Oscillatoria sp. FACHB-1406]|uniref:CHAD domain-containing protein n=1 Tax=Oscillatoria sp. FACHB-1406 TaxID=2692846 RepID=UPI0016831358|nr:CHAD domain-containing protein [Oscillatoria sp. FACHB-1406]MBD2580038.1 CHAD domain-containing protein [Oscillatoria sp. FACHB-1406]
MKPPKADEVRTFSDWAEVAIAKHSHKILKHETAVLKDKDPEELHQMRVGMRRLRSAIAGFAPAIALPAAASAKKVGKVAKILGKLRDLDVLTEALETQYKPALPSNEQKQLNRALKRLEKRRKEVFERVRDTLDGKTYTALKKALTQWLERPQHNAIGSVPIEIVLPDLLLPQVSKLLLHPGWFVSTKIEGETLTITHQNDSKAVESILNQHEVTLHDLRKEAKRSRYQLELFESFYDESYQDFLKEIKAIQEILGEIQDSFVLEDFLDSSLEENIKESMPILAQQLRESRARQWQAWQNLQKTFLDRKNREHFRLIVMGKEVSLFEIEPG